MRLYGIYEKKTLTVMVINSTNIKKTKNQLSSQIIEHKKYHNICWIKSKSLIGTDTTMWMATPVLQMRMSAHEKVYLTRPDMILGLSIIWLFSSMH